MDIVKKWSILFYLIAMMKIVTDASAQQEYSDYCAHFRYNERSIVFKIKNDDYQINFKLCENFHTNDSECPIETVACLQKFNTSEKLSLGLSFDVESNLLKSINGGRCTASQNYSLVVHIDDSVRTPTFLEIDGHCTYHVKMRLPLVNCGLTLFGKYKDLSPLAGSYQVQSLNRTFSINICGVVLGCNSSDSNAFEYQGNSPTSISLAKYFFAAYNGDANLVSFHGKHFDDETRKIDKKLQIALICDWDKTKVQNNDLTYIQPPRQGIKYLFRLETSYGCIKPSVPWTVNENFLVYNLTSICFKNSTGTDGTPSTNGSTYYMHFCGPAHLKDSYAEVRETSHGIDINRGSFLAHLEVTQEGNVRATLDGGAKCTVQNSTQKQFDKSIIEFSCDKIEHGPKFLKKDFCCTYFQWRTPNACPKYNAPNCNYLKNEKHDCVFKTKGKYYNLTSLAGTRSLKHQNPESGNVEFKFDVCGSVIYDDAPCMKDVSVALKNFSATDVSKKLTSLGKFFSFTEKDGNLVLQFITGSYCGTTDYHSTIHFKCSEVEEEPTVLPNTEECRYEFEWKTSHACPHDLGCWFHDAASNTSIDVGHIHPIKFEGEKYNLEFHVCERFYSSCISDECTNVKFENMTSNFLMNMTTLEVFLDRPCQVDENFNKVIFNFVCDLIRDNEHVHSVRKIGCHLIVDYHTNTVCPYQNNTVPLKEQSTKIDLGRVEKLAGQYVINPQKKCYIKSPFTNETLNIRNISNNELFNNHCPTATFNNSHRFVKLAYNSSQTCQLVPGQNISYEVYLLCTNDIKPALPETNNECLLPSEYQGIEYCHFFKAISTTSSTSTLISTVLGCTAVMSIACLGFVLRKRWFLFYRRRRSEFLFTYERNAQI